MLAVGVLQLRSAWLFGHVLGALSLRSSPSARSKFMCVAPFGFGITGRLTVGTFAPDAVTSVTAGGQFAWRAHVSGLRSFVPLAMISPSPASFAPNSSFKPTPYLGFVETCRSARNTGSRLPRSARLNSGVSPLCHAKKITERF